MTWKHVAAIVVGGMLVVFAGVMLLICGRSPICANPASFAAVATLATTVVGAGGMIITGAYGHAQGGKSVQRDRPAGDSGSFKPVGPA